MKTKKFEVRFYTATEKKGDRIRVLGLSNAFIAYDYRYDDALDMASHLLETYGWYPEQLVNVTRTERGAYLFYEQW